MLRGDISNQRSYLFGFRCEDSLFHYKDRNVVDKALNLLVGKTRRAEVNEDVLSAMKYIYWNTEYTIALVIDDAHYTPEAKDFLADLPFNQVFNVLSSSQITMALNTGEMTYYVDECDASRYKVQSKYAITVKELNALLRRHYGRLT